MSWKSEWKKIEQWWKSLLAGTGARKSVGTPKAEANGTTAQRATGQTARRVTGRSLPSVSRASCWEGKNAEKRHMNTLSPKFSDEEAEDRFVWAVQRGCNTVHLFVCNQGDGERAGYSIYGGSPTPGKVDAASVEGMQRRISMARKKGLAVVLWLMADDSSKWNKVLLASPKAYAEDLRRWGVLDDAAAVVLGLEMDEYMSSSQAKALAEAVRGVYGGKVGTHHTSGKAPFASLGDLLFWQTKTGLSEAQVRAQVVQARGHGRPVVMFEMARQPARELCTAALDEGAVGVGNW
jgi:hypothetical protein